MSRTESRRPIRVLSADEIALLRQQQNQAPRSAAQLAALQSADRFRRTLASPSRRAEAAAPAASPRPSTLPPSALPSPAQPAKASAGLALHAVVQQLPENDEPPAVEPLLAADTQGLAAPAAHELPEGEPTTAVLNDGLAVPELAHDPWSEQMAHTIAGLCARAEPSFVNWTVTLPMDPQVLPDTDLRLSLSQHWLSLRFITQSPQSHHLVCRYRQSLLAELERLPNLPHGIDIEVT